MAEIVDARFDGDEPARVTAAYSSTLTPPIGDGWLAAGDAAISFDPLSSQGLFHALYTGLASAGAAERYLSGDVSGSRDYAEKLAEIDAVYQRNLNGFYAMGVVGSIKNSGDAATLGIIQSAGPKKTHKSAEHARVSEYNSSAIS